MYVQQWQPDDDETLKFAIKKYGSNKFKVRANARRPLVVRHAAVNVSSGSRGP